MGASVLDILVGVFDILYSSMGILFHIIEIVACLRLSRNYGGFRFIAHSSAADALLLFQVGICGGFVILSKTEITSPNHRIAINIFMNFTWWSSAYLSVLVTVSRMLCLCASGAFTCLSTQRNAHLICMLVWTFAFAQSYCVTLFPWYVVLYYNPHGYGVTGDWEKYSQDGTQLYFYIFNGLVIATNFLVYSIIMVVILKMNKRHTKVLVSVVSRAGITKDSDNAEPNQLTSNSAFHNRNVERGLLASCFIMWIFDILGQFFINWTSFAGRLRDFFVVFFFMTKAWASTATRLFLSSILRNEYMKLIPLMSWLPKKRLKQFTDELLYGLLRLLKQDVSHLRCAS
ncbi:hypothetical protein Tcan_01414 [Toxocara canis]|uniref:7TM GPCR serpentine receptor class x (Srx) domain-containing protein n=1 Tax=Toxocara canis TaxID=6265 RepID=A0A0B2VWP7_TOXCA|nr:hypothetical protein Tcan_01414 [Toxocara canis]